MIAKLFQDKMPKPSIDPIEPSGNQNNITKARMAEIIADMLSDAKFKDMTIATDSDLITSS